MVILLSSLLLSLLLLLYDIISLPIFIYICSLTDKRVTACTSRREECLDNAPRGHFVPRCKADGSFDDVQCLQATGECWCVDTNGEEIPGTRSIGKLDCSVIGKQRLDWWDTGGNLKVLGLPGLILLLIKVEQVMHKKLVECLARRCFL